MDLITGPSGACGYDLADIERELGPERWQAFSTWLDGQTCIILDGKWCAFPWDYERWVRRHPAPMQQGGELMAEEAG